MIMDLNNVAKLLLPMVCVLIIVCIMSYSSETFQTDAWTLPPSIYVPCMLLITFSLKMINIHYERSSSHKEDESSMDSTVSLDCGAYMAYSYFYGYLRLLLPSTGTQTKGLLEAMENYEDNQNITIAVKKLFILVPLSTHTPPDLKESSYGWMESAHCLEEQERDRGGVKKRKYNNTVYKIYPKGPQDSSQPMYAVVEGASPLLTYYEVQKHFHPHSDMYKKNRKKVVLQFYNTLNELLNNDPDCRHLCELIYYEDSDPRGRRVNVAKVILDSIEGNMNAANYTRSAS